MPSEATGHGEGMNASLMAYMCRFACAISLYNIYIYKNLATHLESEIVKTFLVLAQNGSHQNCPNFWVNSYPPGAHSGTVVAAPRNRRWG
jgi:hypothetical protein